MTNLTAGDNIRIATADGRCATPAIIVRATEKAIMVQGIGYRARGAWFPRAAIVATISCTGDRTDAYHVAPWFGMTPAHIAAFN